MKTTVLALFAVLAAGFGAAASLGVTNPGRTHTETAPVVALSVAGRSVTFAVADNAARSDCAHAYTWYAGSTKGATWRLGKPTDEPCVERPSTGDGISAVAMSATRAVWIQYAGGNLRDWQLFTATRTKPAPHQLAFVEQDVEDPSPIILGQGTVSGVPYAVGTKVTYLGDNGAAIFKWTAPSPVALLAAAMQAPGGAVVAAYLQNGTVDLLSRSGTVVRSYVYAPGALSAIFLAPGGLVSQDGTTVQIRSGSSTKTVSLPAHAEAFAYGQEELFYSLAGSIHALQTTTNVDSLLVTPASGQKAIASYGVAGGFAWAIGTTVYWDCASCVHFGP